MRDAPPTPRPSCRECRQYEEERLSDYCKQCLCNNKYRWEAGVGGKNRPGPKPAGPGFETLWEENKP